MQWQLCSQVYTTPCSLDVSNHKLSQVLVFVKIPSTLMDINDVVYGSDLG